MSVEMGFKTLNARNQIVIDIVLEVFYITRFGIEKVLVSG